MQHCTLYKEFNKLLVGIYRTGVESVPLSAPSEDLITFKLRLQLYHSASIFDLSTTVKINLHFLDALFLKGSARYHKT